MPKFTSTDAGITIEFLGETVKFDKGVNGMERAIRTLKKEVSLFNKQLKFDPSNIDALREKVENLKAQEELAKKVLEEYTKDLAELSARGVKQDDPNWKSTLEHIAKANEDIIAIQKQYEKANDLLGKMESGWYRVGDAISKAGEKIEGVGRSLQPISDKAQDFLSNAINQSAKFEDAFADVEKTVSGANRFDFQEISNGLREMATEVPTAADELAHIAGLAGQMNVPKEQIVEFTRAMVDFGNATDITAQEATKEIAQIYNVIGKGNDFSTLDNLLSTIVDLGNNTATTESAIVEMFRNVAAASSRVGMTESQMAALAATLSSLGLDKGGASAISKIMTNIDKAVDTNSTKLTEWANVAGLSADKFKELWNQDASAGLMAVVEGIAKSNEEGTSFNETLEELGIKEIRQVDTLSRLVNAHEEYAKNIDLANNAYRKGTALSEEAEKRYRTLLSQIQILKNNLTEFAIAIGDILLPYIEWIIQSIGSLVDWLNNLQPHTKMLITRIAAITAVLAPLLIGLGKALTVGGGIFKNIGNLITGFKFLWALLQQFWTFLFPVLQTVGTWIATHIGVVGIIYAVIVAVKILYENCLPFREFVDRIIEKIKTLWEKFKETNWIEALGEKFGWLGEIIGGLIELVKTLVGWFASLVDKALEFLGLKSSIESGAASIGGGRGITALDVSGMRSGGFNSGGMVLNASFNVTSNNVTREDVRNWANWIADDLNEELGRRIR